MTDEQILGEIAAAIREETDNAALDIRGDMTASDVPGWDSLAHVRIVFNMSARFGIRIEMKQTYRAATIADLIPVVKAAPPVKG